jgi:hypothetical protein
MSDIGLQSGFYAQVRDYAELLDDALIEIKTGTSQIAINDAARRLGEFLTTLGGSSDSQDLPTRLMAVLLRDCFQGQNNDWITLGQALLRGEVNDTIINDLEALAWSLEQQQATAMARIRGSAR